MSDATYDALPATGATRLLRVFAWFMIGAMTIFILNSYLTFWLGCPGAASLFAGGDGMLLAAVQLAFYPLVLAAIVYFVWREGERPLRADAAIMSKSVRFIIRWAFFSVLLVGLGDIIVSFMRIEGMLPGLVGEETASAWGFNDNRAPMLHLPLIGISLLLAMVLPTLGFHWLAVLVVLSELLIVLTRFIFSYEQAFQGDLVRFWYGALFLFASAYTLTEDGHVRVDVFYAGLRRRTQGKINAFGCVVMGILFCWVILYFGMASRSAVITAPLISLEVTQAGFGLYVKYLMAAFLGIFAVTMMIQFCAYLLESIADARGDSGGAPHHVHGEDAVTEV